MVTLPTRSNILPRNEYHVTNFRKSKVTVLCGRGGRSQFFRLHSSSKIFESGVKRHFWPLRNFRPIIVWRGDSPHITLNW